MICLAVLEDSLPVPVLSLQFRQSQLLSGTDCKPKQAAMKQVQTNQTCTSIKDRFELILENMKYQNIKMSSTINLLLWENEGGEGRRNRK